MESEDSILITQPDLPDLKEVIAYLEQVWENKWLTNNGKFHKEFEEKLAAYLDVPYISLFTNGTLALITAIQQLKLSGEVITTPYSFIATTHSLIWNNIKPVFVDIEDEYGNINTSKIEAAITPETTAILAVHVYGNPYDVDEINRIANKHNLKVIYDSAHAFGVKINNKSILQYGDLSILSFHATKVFNTFEGGAIVSHSLEVKKEIDLLKNFGIKDENTITSVGINAKMNEFQSLIGLLQLQKHDERIKSRANVFFEYLEKLEKVKGIKIIKPNKSAYSNYAYLPILVNEKEYGKSRDELFNILRSKNIFVRKYFFPLISNIPTYKTIASANKENLKVANSFSEKVICLPIYTELDSKAISRITQIIKSSQ